MKCTAMCAATNHSELMSDPSDEAKRVFENLPEDISSDETDIGLRAHITRIPEAMLAEYDSSWNDEQVVEWEGNFKDDGGLMLVCCEREVGVAEFRQVLEEWLDHRKSIGS